MLAGHGGEPRHELWARARKIRKRREMVARGGLAPHRDRVRVLESKRRQPTDAVQFREAARDVSPGRQPWV